MKCHYYCYFDESSRKPLIKTARQTQLVFTLIESHFGILWRIPIQGTAIDFPLLIIAIYIEFKDT